MRILWLVVFSALLTAGLQAQSKRIVLLAGAPDSHPAGTHEYEISARYLAHALNHSGLGLAAEVHTDGWPQDPSVLEGAAAIVLISAGADRNALDHPLLRDERMRAIEQQMSAGCGLVFIHWSTFYPLAGLGQALFSWTGGQFDYESGPAANGWASIIRTFDSEPRLATPGHPVARGLPHSWAQREEWYARLRLAEGHPGFTPLVKVAVPGVEVPQTVAWTFERAGGGRSFSTTGGHFEASFKNPAFRGLLLNGIAWCSGAKVPDGGVPQASMDPIELLLVTGNDHPAHDWSAKSATLKATFERDPRLRVRVSEDPESLANIKADVVLLNYCNWERAGLSDAARAGLMDHVESGGGLLLVHFANGAFHPSLPGAAPGQIWEAYHQRLSLRSWDHARAASGHDPYGPFRVQVEDSQHPITAGLTDFWTTDELYYRQSGSQAIEPLLSARSLDTNRSEPMAWAHLVGQGRVFQTVLGHDVVSLQVPAVARTLRRAAAWAAARAPLDLGDARSSDAVVRPGLPNGYVSPEAWTPPYRATDVGSEKEEDWLDGRAQRSDGGPAVASSIQTPTGLVARALAVRLGHGREAAMVFDTEHLVLRTLSWGRFLEVSPVRFGLMQMPKLIGQVEFAHTPEGARRGRWRGHYLHGERVILSYSREGRGLLESPWVEHVGGAPAFIRRFEVEAGRARVSIPVLDLGGWSFETPTHPVKVTLSSGDERKLVQVLGEGASLERRGDTLILEVQPSNQVLVVELLQWSGSKTSAPVFEAFAGRRQAPEPLAHLTGGGPRRWEPIPGRGELGSPEGAYAVDTLHLPRTNPWGALLFTSGIDFLPNGDAAVCTAHGDVWIVSGIDDGLEQVTWTRFATGLYRPLGLLVQEGVVTVCGRDQITRLHDLNADGEADWYECFNNQLEVRGDGHAYAMGLERDALGNLYFQKSGGTSTAHGGTTLRVSADGGDLRSVAFGFRHANGIGVRADGLVTNADNQGNWIPSTRLNMLFKEGYYGGYQPAYRGSGDSNLVDPPLCWIPHAVDNSAGGQVWVDGARWGLPAGSLLHTSFGRCKLFHVLWESVDGVPQGGVVPFAPTFLSGVMRGRFRPQDGQLWVTGLEGWQTEAREDGCLQRVRFVGGPLRRPIALHARVGELELEFAEPLDPSSVRAQAFAIERWNYRYAAQYGSADWSVEEPEKQGRDVLLVLDATLRADGRSVVLTVPALAPVMQQSISWTLQAVDGGAVEGVLYHTVNRLPQRR